MVGTRATALAMIMVLSMAAVAPAGPEAINSAEGRFSVVFPDRVKTSQQVVPTPVGNLTAHVFAADFPGQNAGVVVTYTDYPPQVIASKSVDQMLDGSAAGSVQGMKGTPGKTSRITQAGTPGREFTWTMTSGASTLSGRGRIFLVGSRLYQVLVIGPDELMVPTGPADAVFESFKFSPAPAPAAAPAKASAPRAMNKAAAAKGPASSKKAAGALKPWVTHNGVSFDGFWDVQMPTRPKRSEEPGLFGVRTRNVFVSSDGPLTYTLKVQIVPDEMLNQDRGAILEAARDKLAEEVRGKVVEESDAKLAGADGRAYRLDAAGPRPATVVARAAIVGKRKLAVLSVAGPAAAAAGPSAERFYDSFQVNDR